MRSWTSEWSRREVLAGATLGAAGWMIAGRSLGGERPVPKEPAADQALVAITLDLEMARNFPTWETTHWDYEKGNLDEPTKRYAVEACRRVKERGGVIHTFAVGRVLEQENVDWLKEIARQGHPIGNHTYDHVYVLATDMQSIQFRFQRAPWLIQGKTPAQVIRENIQLTSTALQERMGMAPAGFRTPGGFADGLSGREDLQEMLLDLGFTWVSSRYPAHAGIRDLHGSDEPPAAEAFQDIVESQRDAQPFVYPSGLVEIPMSPISDIGAFRNGRWKLEYFLQATEMAVKWVIEHQAVFDFLSHPSCLGVVDPKFRTIDLICDLVEQSQGRATIVDLNVIAARAKSSPRSSSVNRDPEEAATDSGCQYQ